MGKEEDIVRQRLGSDRVNGVKVVSDVNTDGESILRIVVIYEGSKARVSAQEMSDITNQIWLENLKKGDTSFPVPSFISSDDNGVLHPAE